MVKMENGFVVPTIENFVSGFVFSVFIDQHGKDVEGWYSFAHGIDSPYTINDIETLLMKGEIRCKKFN